MQMKAVIFPNPVKISIILLFFLSILAANGFAAPAMQQPGVSVIPLSTNGSERGHSIAFSPDGRLVAVGTTSGVLLFDAQTNEQARFIETASWARSLAFSPDGRKLAVGLFDGTIRLYNAPGGQPDLTFAGHEGRVRATAFTPDGSELVSVSDDGSVRTWRTSTGRPLQTLTEGLLEPRTIAISPGGELLAVGMRDGSIGLFNLDDLSLLRSLNGHTDWVRSLAFSPDGSQLASGGFDKTIRVWDIEGDSSPFVLEGHTSSVLGVAFSPDGERIASGSVDTTVRLWKASDGSALLTFQGHEGFVFSVAFSPDGKTLASGSEDNTLRLWDLSSPLVLQHPDETGPATPSDCRLCHHSRGLIEPPRVTELRCDACHPSGIGVNWCPFFSQSKKAELSSYSSRADLPAGVQVGSEELSISLAFPANGETLYTMGEAFELATFGGTVHFRGDASSVTVRLDLWSGDQITVSQTVQPNPDGSYRVKAVLNPGMSAPFPLQPGDKECTVCHINFIESVPLPNGLVRAVVTATTPKGEQATDERWFAVDVSGRAAVNVQVRDLDTGQPIEGAPVKAETLLYNWRERFASGSTETDGTVAFSLEALSQAETHYQLEVDQAVVDGVLYEGAEAVELTIPAGAGSVPNVELSARRRKGSIAGMLRGADGKPLPGAVVWAAAIPGGPAHQATTDQSGRFEFSDLDVTEYLLAASGEGAGTAEAMVNLIESPDASVDLNLPMLARYKLAATDEEGSFLPFFWIVDENIGLASLSNPLSGEATLAEEPERPVVRTVSAPGHYAQAVRIDPNMAEETAKVSLLRRPDLHQAAWGQGRVTIPAETIAEAAESRIDLTRGWIWGKGGGTEPLVIRDCCRAD